MPASSLDSTIAFPLIPITPTDVADFRRIVAEEFGVTLEEREAWGRLADLLTLYRIVLGPLPEDPEKAVIESSNVLALASV